MRANSRNVVRTCALLGVIVALASIGALVIRNGRDVDVGISPKPGTRHLMRELRTSLYKENRLQLRVSADSVAVQSPRLFGPLRVGFLKGIFAHNVVIETFEPPAADGPANASSAPRAPSPINDALVELLPQPARRGISSAEVDGLRWVRHEGDRVILELKANHCESSLVPPKFTCRNGKLQEGEHRRVFRQASYDGTTWSID